MRKHSSPLWLFAAACIAFTPQVTKADALTFQFDPSPVGLLPGDTFTLTGILTNTTANTVFLHGDMVGLNDPSVNITLDDLPFFLNAPGSLDPNGTPGAAYAGPFLDITIGPDVTPGVYTGFFALSGGATPTLDDPLGTAAFSVTVTPEPQAWTMLAAAGLSGAGWLFRRKTRRH